MYSNIGKTHPTEWASTILAIIAIFVTSPIYYFYRKGPDIRSRSKFAQQVMQERKKQHERRKSSAGGGYEKSATGPRELEPEHDEEAHHTDL